MIDYISRAEADALSDIFYKSGSTLGNRVELRRDENGNLEHRRATGKIWYRVMRPRNVVERVA